MSGTSYLQSILMYPDTCGGGPSKSRHIEVVGAVLLSLLLAFSICRSGRLVWEIKPKSPSKSRRTEEGKVVSVWIGELLNFLAVCAAVVAISLFIVARNHGLGQHLCDEGLTKELVLFTQTIIAASQVDDKNTELMTWVAANAHTLDPILTMKLQQFLSNFATTMKYLYGCDTAYTLSVTLQKFSNDRLLLSMFGFNNRSFQRFIYWHMGATAAVLVLSGFLSFGGIWPIEASWDIAVTRQRFWSPKLIYLSTSIANIILDAVVVPVPIYFVWKLRIAASRKAFIIGLFFFQLLACCFGIARISMLDGLFGADLTYNAVTPLVLTMAQLTIFIISFSFPALRLIFLSIRSTFRHLGSNTSTIPLNDVRASQRHGYMRESVGSEQWAQWDDCFIDDIPDNFDDDKPAPVSDIESTGSCNGFATLVESRV
ncbi:uncharacterized protein LY89DRAFT_729678 [Mollisia scopiformis]|uniref:Rhodopsin domain-containing protein n=1 Tax=Mollisia scopiformis TaxID=149040 RepID=A0A194XPU4_MOLSC|nr:uncharacterized protein LY89DRAFT_729678 [Mollisia scopiformis]KUJ22213.1 hypothetical protein LY89DRAFT_729678 [Mollisia scopiformis]